MHTQTLFQLFNAFEDCFATQLAIDNMRMHSRFKNRNINTKIERYRGRHKFSQKRNILNFEKLILENSFALTPKTIRSNYPFNNKIDRKEAYFKFETDRIITKNTIETHSRPLRRNHESNWNR